MSWNYSGNPANSKLDSLRFLIADTKESQPIMQDEEINFLISTFEDDNALKYELFSRAATIFARDIKRSLGPQAEDPTERLKFYKDRADFYKRQMSAVGISLPTYAYPKVFRKGMNNNPPWPQGSDDYVP